MSYLSFHLVFLLPPIALLLTAYKRPPGFSGGRRVDLAIPIVCGLALSYTIPWDNYLVAQHIWWYGPDRVLATIGYVPVEEYLFFVLQPLLTGLLVYQYLNRWSSPTTQNATWAPWIGAALFGGLTGLGVYFLLGNQTRTLYLGLILLWASPLLAGMWLYDGETLWSYRSTLLTTTAVPTLYLWIADAVALRSEIWTISPRHTIGISVFTLPLEEASFFLLTNLLVVQGILLLLYGSHDTGTSGRSRS